MGIFDRMGKVISSNVNNLLDKAEDDRKLLDLTVEEMGEQLKRGQKEVISAVASAKQLKKKHDDLVADAEKWERRAELALKTGDEALAREALKQKKRVTSEAENVERSRQEQQNHALDLKAELERMEQKHEEIKMRKSTIANRAEQARSGTEGLGARGGSNAFENFRRMEEKIEGREAQNSAMAEVEEALGNTEKTRDLEARFRDLERGTGSSSGGASTGTSEIDDELAALKKRIRV